MRTSPEASPELSLAASRPAIVEEEEAGRTGNAKN